MDRHEVNGGSYKLSSIRQFGKFLGCSVSLLVLISLIACTWNIKAEERLGISEAGECFTLDPKVEETWTRIVRPALEVNPSADGWMFYQFGETLPVPLFAAFAMKNEAYISDFTNHFANFAPLLYEDIGLLNKMDYVWLAADYLALCLNYREDIIPANLDDILYEIVMSAWNSPAWQWGRDPYPDMAARLDDKLEYKGTRYSYQNALIDEESFLLAAAGLMYYYYSNSRYSCNTEWAGELSKITKYIPQIIDNFFVYGDGWWKFQPGVWTDHPDYLYAVYDTIDSIKGPVKTQNIMEDTSHFSRMPRLLYDFRYAVDDSYDKKIDEITDSISRYFISNVLEKPNSEHRIYLTRNYMSGENGLYRWNYGGRGENYAHRPYSLSGTFYRGTWVFLGTEAIRKIYRNCVNLFPFSRDEVLEITTLSVADFEWDLEYAKEPPGSIGTPFSLESGFSELCCILASLLSCL
jgi:hypothetical protein